MAYDVTPTGSKCLTVGSAPVTQVPITLSAWFQPTVINTDHDILTVCNNTNGSGSVVVMSARANNQLSAGVFRQLNPFFVQSLSGGSVSNNTWHSGVAVYTSNSNRLIYLNGTAGTANTTSFTPLNLNRCGIGCTARDTPASIFTGQIAEVGIWNVALTADEAASLARGMTCDKVRPQSLVFYAPLVRDLIDYKGGLTITNNNTATVANHPRVYA